MAERLKPRVIIGRLNTSGILALAGVIGPIVFIITDLNAAISQPGYNPIRDSISSLAWSPMGWLQTIGFVVAGISVEVFVRGLLFNIRRRSGFRFGIGLLVCFGFGLLLIGAFQTDPSGSQATIEGMIHSYTARAVFAIFPVAGLLIAPSLKKDTAWKGVYIYTIAASGIALAMVIGRPFIPADLTWFGLYERILVANTVIWLEVMAVRLLCLSLNTSKQLNDSMLS